MEDFWKSVQTIQTERGADYRAFSLFSATHWAELLGAAAVIFLCAVIYYRCREVTRHQILRAVFVLMLADEFMKQAVLLYTGQWNVTYLPLHLCSINIFVCWYDAIHQSRWSKEILYALCIPGAVVAMLSPSWQRLPVWNLLHLHSYSIHVLLILYPVLLLAGGFRPQVHHIRWVLAFLCAIATPIFFLNRLLKTNFFFSMIRRAMRLLPFSPTALENVFIYWAFCRFLLQSCCFFICHGTGQSGINVCSVQEIRL